MISSQVRLPKYEQHGPKPTDRKTCGTPCAHACADNPPLASLQANQIHDGLRNIIGRYDQQTVDAAAISTAFKETKPIGITVLLFPAQDLPHQG